MHAPTQSAIDQVFRTYQLWHPAVFGVDATGGQILFFQQLVKEAHARQVAVPFRPVALQGEKVFQIETALQPLASSGRLFRPPESQCKELREEWVNFPGAEYRDGLDALANAIRLLPSCNIPSLRELTKDQYKRFLERSGYSQDEIARKMLMR